MRYFLTPHIPPFTRVLLVESGSRGVFDRLIPRLYPAHGGESGDEMELDLITCHPGTPDGFRGRVYRVQDYSTSAERRELVAELAARGYTVTGILCSNEDIMTKWKWMLAARLPSKVLIVNENADSLWIDRAHWRHIVGMVRVRLDLHGPALSPSMLRVLLLPFSAIYLLAYALVVHTKRRIRMQ